MTCSMQRRRALRLLTVAALVALASGPQPAYAQENDVTGSWFVVEAERNGVAAPDLVGHELVFQGERFAIGLRGRILYEGSYAIDPVADPPSIDFQHQLGEAAGATWEGIYELNGDRLVICDDAADPNAGRPQDFTTSSGSGHVLLTFTRR